MGVAPGHVVGGRYRLARQLATGGMGSIWVARHVELDIDVAIKFVTTEKCADEQAQKRFRREARTAARLASEHVVRVHDFGVDEETPYLAMELLHGEDLLEHLERHGRLSKERAATLLRQVSRGLEVAHDAGVVHRDLKPSNLFLARTGKDGASEVVKILDFGVAKERAFQPDADATNSVGLLLGSPPYMSPEQARAGAVDHTTDLWALGAIAFEMLTGCRLFAGGNLADTVAKICSDPIPRASDVAADLGGQFDDFFRRALERDRDRRFQSASELSAAFETAAGMPSQGENAAPAAARGRETETLSVRVEGSTFDPVQASSETKGNRKGMKVALGVAAAALAVGLAARQLTQVGSEAGGTTAPASLLSNASAATSAPSSGARPDDGAPSPAPMQSSVGIPDAGGTERAVARRGKPAPRSTGSSIGVGAAPPAPSARPAVDPVFGLPTGTP